MNSKLIAVALLALLVPGCAGSFEEARAVPRYRALRDVARCQTLSDRQVGWTGVVLVTGALAAPTGLATIPADGAVRTELAVGTAVLAATTVGAEYLASAAGTAYVRECQ